MSCKQCSRVVGGNYGSTPVFNKNFQSLTFLVESIVCTTCISFYVLHFQGRDALQE